MNTLKLAKFCNNLLSVDNEEQNEFVDLDNHVFRLNYLLENFDLKDDTLSKDDAEEAERLLKEFFGEVKKNCKIDEYLNGRKCEFKNKMKHLRKNNEKSSIDKDVECIEIEDSEDLKPTKIIKNVLIKEPSIDDSVTLNEELIEKSKFLTDSFIKLFDKGDTTEKEIQENFSEVMNEKNLEYIKHFCLLLSSKMAESVKYEQRLSTLAVCLANISSNSSTITYTKLAIVLRNLFSNYLILINQNKTTKQIETFTLSKQMLSMCSNLFKSFPNQFTEDCFIEWIKLLIMESNTKNSKNIEFLLKIFKDLFNESEAILVLNFIVSQQNSNQTWNEDYYVFLNNIFDKILKPNQSDLILLVNKMKNDCKLFSKSLPFAKFLLNVINRLKNLAHFDGDQELPSEETNENRYIEPIRQDILLIIEENQTLMKKKLMTML